MSSSSTTVNERLVIWFPYRPQPRFDTIDSTISSSAGVYRGVTVDVRGTKTEQCAILFMSTRHLNVILL